MNHHRIYDPREDLGRDTNNETREKSKLMIY